MRLADDSYTQHNLPKKTDDKHSQDQQTKIKQYKYGSTWFLAGKTRHPYENADGVWFDVGRHFGSCLYLPASRPCFKQFDSLAAITTVRPPNYHRRGRRTHFRLRGLERLVRARHSGVGVSTARAVSGQGLRHQHLSVDRDESGA